MKSSKVLVLVAVAAMAMATITATASATETLTSPKGTPYFGALHAKSEGHVVLKPEQLPATECEMTFEVNVTTNGTPASGPISSFLFEPCTNSWHVTRSTGGTLSVNSAGTVTSNGATIEATRFGITCRYVTANTDIGVMTDSTKTGGTATLHFHGLIPFHSGSPLCGSGSTTWKGSFSIANPMALYLD